MKPNTATVPIRTTSCVHRRAPGCPKAATPPTVTDIVTSIRIHSGVGTLGCAWANRRMRVWMRRLLLLRIGPTTRLLRPSAVARCSAAATASAAVSVAAEGPDSAICAFRSGPATERA